MTEKDNNLTCAIQTKIIRLVDESSPLELACGKKLAPIDVAYETYGKLNSSQDNAVLICHALSGNAHVAGKNATDDKKSGWWDNMVGPGKGIDTNKYFVICSNFLGGCSGTTGPSSINPATGNPYGLDFPIITIADMVKVQKLLADKLGIKRLSAVIGGSLGGMQVLQWAIEYPDFVRAAIAIATASHLGPQAIAFDAVGRNAILADPYFVDGQYKGKNGPDRGLSIARMIGHITYLSEQSMREKFGRKLHGADQYSYDFNSEFAVEAYLDYQGQTFVERFDANSYLYITKAMDYFDLQKDYGSLTKAFSNTNSRFLIISFTSDWLFSPAQSELIVDALVANNKDVSYYNIDSPYGHDSFLLEPESVGSFISGFLDATHRPNSKRQYSAVPLQRPTSSFERAKRTRIDYALIESVIEPCSTVLDVGCGDGELLANLTADKNIKGKGIELSEDLVLACVNKGLSIIQRDIERGLHNYADKSFDIVILSQTVQTLKQPEKVFKELLRVGRKVIVSFPNFGYWKCRTQLFFRGKVPLTRQLPFNWYDSPNTHCLSLKDFEKFCRKLGVKVERIIPLVRNHISSVRIAPNLFAEQVIYITSKN